MKYPYDPNEPIENIYKQVEKAVEYASVGDTPYTPLQVISTTYQLIFNTRLFADDYKIWKRKATATKNWAEF